jgi:hypothetical protein
VADGDGSAATDGDGAGADADVLADGGREDVEADDGDAEEANVRDPAAVASAATGSALPGDRGDADDSCAAGDAADDAGGDAADDADDDAAADGDACAGAPSCVHPFPVAGTSTCSPSCPASDVELSAAVRRPSSSCGAGGAASANTPSARPVSATGITRVRRRTVTTVVNGARAAAARRRARDRKPAERAEPTGAWCTGNASRCVKSRGVSL